MKRRFTGISERDVMKLPRRQFLYLAAGVVLPAMSRVTWSQAYPTRPVRLISGFPAGGPSDILARLMGQWLSERLGQPFVVENRPGAASNIATEAVVRGAADGYTLLIVTSANTINATLYDKLNYNFIRDTVPIAGFIRVPQVLEVHPSVPVKTVPEFITYAKAHPGKLNMASAGNGTVQHVAGELFKVMTGVDLLHVPYRGQAPALVDMLGGQDQVMFDTMPASIEYLKAGKLRPLAVTTATRSDALPDVPILADFVPGYESSALYGIAAPRNTPAEIIDKLNKEINAGLADPKIKARLADLGGTVLAGSPADFGRLVAEETEKWAKVVKFSGAKAE
jgi:tripartite-type tricarboxylate transporter receptor subunit TctC